MSERIFDIKQAAEKLGYTPQYIRMLIQEDRIVAEQIPISPGARVMKYVMTEAALDDFVNNVESHTRREDSRTKWVVYATFEEMEIAMTALDEAGLAEITSLIRPANDLKSMPEWLKEHLDGQTLES